MDAPREHGAVRRGLSTAGTVLLVLGVLVFYEELNDARLVAKAWLAQQGGAQGGRGTHQDAIDAADASAPGLAVLRGEQLHPHADAAGNGWASGGRAGGAAAAAQPAGVPLRGAPADDYAAPSPPPPSPPPLAHPAPAPTPRPPSPAVATPEGPGAAAAGEFASKGKVQPLDEVVDLEEPGVLEAVAEKRSFKKELIITIFNPKGSVMGLNLVRNLAALNIEHYLIIGNTAELCEEFMRFDKNTGCAWSSYLKDHPRLSTYEVSNEEGGAPFRLWWARFAYMARLSAKGYNVMYVDIDVSFRVDPYPVFKGPLGRHNLLSQRERAALPGMNIGIVYCQNCKAGSGGHWVLENTVQRMMDILESEPPRTKWDGRVAGGAKELLWDQHIFNDVLESAAGQFLSVRRSGERVIEPSERNAWIKKQGYPDVPWNEEPVTVPLGLMDSGKPSMIFWHPISPLGKEQKEQEADTVVAAPGWLFGGWSGVIADPKQQGVEGWWNTQPAPNVMSHLVGAINKVHTYKVLRWWAYDSEKLRVHRGADWELPADAPVLAVKLPGLRLEKYEGGGSDAMQDAFPHAIMKMMALGYASGRRAVVPQVDCTSPWIKKAQNAWGGIQDRERIVVGRCDGLEPCCSSLPFTCGTHMLSHAELEYHFKGAPTAEVDVSELGSGTISPEALRAKLPNERVVYLTGVKDGSELPTVTPPPPEVQHALRQCEQVDCGPDRSADFPHPGPCRRK